MTPDGISTWDWNLVQATAMDIFHALQIDDEILGEHHTVRLLELLDELESRYGRRPGILATRADFTDDPAVAICLHEEALNASTDPLTTRLSLQSLIPLMIEQGIDRSLVGKRLDELENLTSTDSDPSDLDELKEIQTAFQCLEDD